MGHSSPLLWEGPRMPEPSALTYLFDTLHSSNRHGQRMLRRYCTLVWRAVHVVCSSIRLCYILLLCTCCFPLPHAAVQKQGDCSACVGFAVTAAAEAAVNVYKQQSWHKLNLSEQVLCFCK